jgi:sugar lactone lactonase YvrE
MLNPILDLFRGRAVTIPPMDGALRPNTALDECEIALEIDAPDNLCAVGERILFSSGRNVVALPERGGKATPVEQHETTVVALAASPAGIRATALDDGRIVVADGKGGKTIAPPEGYACPTALAFADETTLIVCHGSSRHRATDWVVDLMEKNSSGSVWKFDLETAAQTCLARDLAFPNGVLVTALGLVISEAWRHRLLRIAENGAPPRPVLSKLPGYPARIHPAADGGAWLALFAPRNRLIEFILLEDDYRHDMMREVERDHWIAPSLSSAVNFLEPLQCGGVRSMGIHKPWSPSRSYGLIARLDRDLQPVASFHSRANGLRHGITSAIETNGRLLASAKGGRAILSLAVES